MGYFIFFLFSFYVYLFSQEISFGEGGKYPLSTLIKHKTSVTKVGSHSYRLELVRSKIDASELFLDFENLKSSELKDKKNNYPILYSLYTVTEGESHQGKRYASFTTRDSQIQIATNNSRLLSQKIISEPFYFSFHIMPGELEQNSNIFYKTYITGSKKYGIECNIIRNSLEVTFHNFFYYNSKDTRTYKLRSPNSIRSKEWTHIFISVEPITGYVRLYENGVETAQFQALYSEIDKTPLIVGFHPNDTNPLIIGRAFYGKLDNFMIGKGLFEEVQNLSLPYNSVFYNPNIKFASHARGYAISRVLSTRYSHSIPSSIHYKMDLPEGTLGEVLYRFSDKPFEENSNEISWQSYDPKLFLEQTKNLYFQYFQWKVILRADYSGKFTPSLSSFSLKYKESKPPAKPFGLRVTSYDHNTLKVCLSWNSNHERDVINGGGYFIHYGVSPNEMIATLEVDESLSKIQGIKHSEDIKQKYNSLEQCVTNELIQINAERKKEKNLLFLRHGLTYYFKISAYNDKYPWGVYDENFLVGYDQKSELSTPVSFTFKTQPSEWK